MFGKICVGTGVISIGSLVKPPDTLKILVEAISMRYFRYRQHGSYRLSLRNQILLVMIWLRRYPTFSHLAMHFGIGITTVHDCIHNMLPYMHT